MGQELIGLWFVLMVSSPLYGAPRDCTFASYHPGEMSHFVQYVAADRVFPDYPADLKSAGVGGTVSIRILVDNRGRVMRTCPVRPTSGAGPNLRLVKAAEEAAAKWKFKPNFGQPPTVHFRFRYIRDMLVFQFEPPAKTTEGLQ